MPPPTATAPLTLNQKVVVFARGKAGQKVGAGQCWDLGEEALRAAGAMTSSDLGPVAEDTDYVWGDRKAVKDVQPGDIIQLRDHETVFKTVIDVTFPDGSGSVETLPDGSAVRGHHTAVATSTLDSDGALATLEQHVKPLGQVVQAKKLYTRDVAPVTTTTIERRLNPNTKKVEAATVVTTVTVTVTGTLWVYKPKPKSKP